jgi:hypothetical protein
VGVVDVVCESVWVSVLAVWVASEFGTVFGVGAVTGEDWIVGADVTEVGFSGLTGDTGLVGLFIDFLHVSCVVTHGPKVG